MTLQLLSLPLRSLWARPSRTLLTAFGIVLGVAVNLAISVSNESTLDALASVFSEAAGKAHLAVMSATISDEGFDEGYLHVVGGVPGVQTAAPSLQARAMLAEEVVASRADINLLGISAQGLLLYGVDPAVDTQVRTYRVVSGTFLPADLDAYQIVLVDEFARGQEIGLGDDLPLVTPTGIEFLQVVGFVAREGAGTLNNGAFGVVPLHTVQALFNRSGELDQIDVLAEPHLATGSGLEGLKGALQARLGERYSVTYPATQGRRVSQMLDTYQMGLNFFSVIALFVGGYLIYNAFSMTVAERTREIGMLRTVGMSRGQVMQQILSEAGILGVAGSAVGVGVGIGLAQGLIRFMEVLLGQTVREVRVPTDGLLISVLVGLAVTLVAAAIPALQAGRISPLEALRIRGREERRQAAYRGWSLGLALLGTSTAFLYLSPLPLSVQNPLDQAAVLALFLGATLMVPITVEAWERVTRPMVRQLYGNEGQLGSSNVRRARLRTTLTVAALMVGVAMILAIQSLAGTFVHDIQAWIEAYLGGDLYVYSQVPMRMEIARRLERVEGVASVTPMRYLDVGWLKPDGTSERLGFLAVDPDSFRRVTSFVFVGERDDPVQLLDRLAGGNALFISSVLSEQYGLKEGDTIRLETRRGPRDFEVAAIVVDMYNQGLVVQGSWDDMRRYFRVDDASAFLVSVQDESRLPEVRERIERLYGRRYHLVTESNQSIRASALELTNRAFSMFDVLALIAIIVAALGVVNTLTMNVLERTREIGMLRSLGMTRWQVGKMILAEAGLMGLIGAVFGLAFGLFLSRLFLMAASAVQGYQLTYVLPGRSMVTSVLLALLVSQVAALGPARRAAGLRIIEAIQFE